MAVSGATLGFHVAPASLRGAVSAAHELSQRLLREAEQDSPEADPRQSTRQLDAAVAVLSEHVAAMEVAVHPVVYKRLRGRFDVEELLGRTRETEWAMRHLEMLIYGDVHARRTMAELHGQLTDAAHRLDAAEQRLVDALEDVLSPAEQSDLARRLSKLTSHAPTRPHIAAPHRGPATMWAFRFNAVWDRFFDLMDNRRVPATHPARVPAAPGKWGFYLLGKPLPPARPDTSADTDHSATRTASAR